jgi:homoserine O-succinyltransferase
MPLVAHTEHPSYQLLQNRGHEILPLEQALAQDIRELHVGLLNMMPDAALSITDLQFMRLIGSCNKIVQVYVHPFSIPGLTRSEASQGYIRQFYEDFSALREEGLDALIITGANVTNPSLRTEAFWEPLREVIDWATENVTSILCSCLATHALMNHLYQIDRHRLPQKKWGVYNHRITDRRHPLLQDINTRFDVPHSRWNEVRREDMIAAGLNILVESDEAGVHLAVSPDQFRIVFLQGHPEYGRVTLLKEYKREVKRFIKGGLDAVPPIPEHYFPAAASALADEYIQHALRNGVGNDDPPPFPETAIEAYLDDTWGDTAKAIFNNWLGLVYKLTHVDRHIQFMEGINPHNPLNLLRDPDGFAV